MVKSNGDDNDAMGEDARKRKEAPGARSVRVWMKSACPIGLDIFAQLQPAKNDRHRGCPPQV